MTITRRPINRSVLTENSRYSPIGRASRLISGLAAMGDFAPVVTRRAVPSAADLDRRGWQLAGRALYEAIGRVRGEG